MTGNRATDPATTTGNRATAPAGHDADARTPR